MRYIMGLDESGTGAWAGVATVACCAVLETDSDALWRLGVADSKALTALKRERAAWELLGASFVHGNIHEVTARALSDNHAMAKREGFAQAALPLLEQLVSEEKHEVWIVIDGNYDHVLSGYFERVWGIKPHFAPKADADFSVVAAASCLAKAHRSAVMAQLHAIYPAYGWDQNDGYGTAQHQAAIEAHGITPEHRKIKNLRKYFP